MSSGCHDHGCLRQNTKHDNQQRETSKLPMCCFMILELRKKLNVHVKVTIEKHKAKECW